MTEEQSWYCDYCMETHIEGQTCAKPKQDRCPECGAEGDWFIGYATTNDGEETMHWTICRCGACGHKWEE